MSNSVGGGLFRPNKERGVWSSSQDFVWACLNNAFRVDNIYGLAIVPMIATNGFFSVLWWLFNALLYAVPIFFIQSFLGQFSSSGYISALRILPLFKGLGYFGLAMNFISLGFHSVLIAVPILYLTHSLQPTLPWSCDATHPWDTPANNDSNEFFLQVSHCTFNHSQEIGEDFVFLSIPSVEFFRHKLADFNFEVFAYLLVVWTAVAYVVYQGSQKLGIFLRYSTITVVTLLTTVFFRMVYMPGVLDHMGVSKPFHTGKLGILWLLMPAFMAFMTFGPGWGSVLSLASYNKFKTDIVRVSWTIPICQVLILILLSTLSNFAEVTLTRDHQTLIPTSQSLPWMDLLAVPSTLASIEFPHFWTWMFVMMILLGSFNLMLTQMFSIQTALLDEFERLRAFRRELIFGSAAVLALLSAPFCTVKGHDIIGAVLTTNVFSQCVINLLLILGVLWLYGHEHLQRDVEFMTEKVVATWKLYYIRFVTPLLFGLMLFIAFLFGDYHFIRVKLGIVCFIMVFLPWIIVPVYCGYKLCQVSGGWRLRWNKSIKANNWYPVDDEDKQRYDDAFGSQESGLTTVML